ncbi:MAG: inorganic diphosphatase [Firmicutes bacterium]|nr:inorganic diphosphatase [Bacillota bacterium]
MGLARGEVLVEAIVEIPKGAQNKYEYDEGTGFFRLDRVLYSPVHYPADYGFVRGTRTEDGDPLDILILVSNPTFPGCLVPARVIGALVTEDERGMDTKLLSVAAVDPRYERVEELRHLSPHSVREIEYFFAIYKELEGKKSAVTGWRNREFAVEVLARARKGWEEANPRGSPASRAAGLSLQGVRGP